MIGNLIITCSRNHGKRLNRHSGSNKTIYSRTNKTNCQIKIIISSLLK